MGCLYYILHSSGLGLTLIKCIKRNLLLGTTVYRNLDRSIRKPYIVSSSHRQYEGFKLTIGKRRSGQSNPVPLERAIISTSSDITLDGGKGDSRGTFASTAIHSVRHPPIADQSLEP
jgi:hypothetical protein